MSCVVTSVAMLQPKGGTSAILVFGSMVHIVSNDWGKRDCTSVHRLDNQTESLWHMTNGTTLIRVGVGYVKE
jgi:hypothetical protein